MKPTAACPSPANIREYLLGRTSEATADSFEAHLASCPHCRQALSDIPAEDDFVADFRAGAHVHPPNNPLLDRLVDNLHNLLRPDRTTAHDATPPADGEATPAPGCAAPNDPEDLLTLLSPPSQPGELGRLGTYRILKVLGTGGMGVVFLAEDVPLRRMVAVKAMRPALAANASARQRFLREAQLTAALSHDHVVAIHQVSEERGVPFLAMPLLEGESLDARLKREGRLPVAEALRIGREAAEGLAAAHQRGLIHRDIKPANLWLEGERGRVKVLDFGLARSCDGDAQLTQSGVIMGTPAYMAPEQAGGVVDHRADLFSLGCVLYRMATGQLPFAGETAFDVLARLARDQPRPPRELNPDLPPALANLILRLLEKNPAQRPQTARAVADALREIEAARESKPATTARPARRSRLPWAIAAALLLAIGITAAVVFIIQTSTGTIVIETDDPDVEVSIRRGGQEVVILDKKSNQQATIKAGTYTVELTKGDKEKLTLETKEFTLKRGDKAIVRVTRKPPTPPAPPSAPPTLGKPLSPAALVRSLATIPGLLGWSIETIGCRGLWTSEFSPDARQLATFGQDGVVRIWDMKNQRLLRVLLADAPGAFYWDGAGEGQYAQSLAWSPSGESLAALDATGNVRIWLVRTGKKLLDFTAKAGLSIAWSPDGKMLAVGGERSEFGLWDASTGEKIVPLTSAGEHVLHLAWAPSSKVLAVVATGSRAKSAVELWDVEKDKRVTSLDAEIILNIRSRPTWSHDGKSIAVAVWEANAEKVKLFDAGTGKLIRALETGGRVAFAPDDKTLFSRDGVWDIASGNRLRPIQTERFLKVSPEDKIGDPVGWSADGQYLVAGAVWDSTTGKVVFRMPEGVEEGRAVWGISPDRKSLAMATDSGVLRVWDLSTGKIKYAANNLGFSAAGFWWYSNGQQVMIERYKNEPSLLFDTASWESRQGPRINLTDAVMFGTNCLVQRGKSDFEVWSIEAEPKRRVLENTKEKLSCYAFSCDDQWVALVKTGSKSIGIWDTSSGKRIRELESDSVIISCSGSPDGKYLASGDGHKVRIWDPHTGKEVRSLAGPDGWGQQLSWSDDSKTVVSLDDHGTIRQWDHETSTNLRTSKAPSPDASWPYFRTIRDVDNHRERGVVVAMPAAQGLAISPEGHYRVSPQAERQIVYVVQTDKGQETLTPEEFSKRYGWTNQPDKVRLTVP